MYYPSYNMIDNDVGDLLGFILLKKIFLSCLTDSFVAIHYINICNYDVG